MLMSPAQARAALRLSNALRQHSWPPAMSLPRKSPLPQPLERPGRLPKDKAAATEEAAEASGPEAEAAAAEEAAGAAEMASKAVVCLALSCTSL